MRSNLGLHAASAAHRLRDMALASGCRVDDARFGIELILQGVGNDLRRWRLRPQKPARQARAQDPEEFQLLDCIAVMSDRMMTLILGLDTCRRTGYGSTSRRKAVRAAQDKLLMLGAPQRRTITEK